MRVNDSPSDEVYQTRLQGAQTAMKRAGIDVLALSGPDFHNYFAGLWGLPVGRPVWFVLQQYGKPAFVAPAVKRGKYRRAARRLWLWNGLNGKDR